MNNSIRMGEIRVATGDDRLRTLLGSCIGLILHDPRRHIAGLAHIQLPNSQLANSQRSRAERSTKPNAHVEPGRYADTAVPELLRQLQTINRDHPRFVAHLAGGADMFPNPPQITVGKLNLEAVETLLDELNIPVASRHCGGVQGRRVLFDIRSGKITIESLANPSIKNQSQQTQSQRTRKAAD